MCRVTYTSTHTNVVPMNYLSCAIFSSDVYLPKPPSMKWEERYISLVELFIFAISCKKAFWNFTSMHASIPRYPGNKSDTHQRWHLTTLMRNFSISDGYWKHKTVTLSPLLDLDRLPKWILFGIKPRELKLNIKSVVKSVRLWDRCNDYTGNNVLCTSR